MHNVKAPFLSTANILVTGGAGFIGSCFIRYVLEQTDFRGRIVNYDKLTYAGNLLNLEDISRKFDRSRYVFERGDICDLARVQQVLATYAINVIVHFAAESHVDRSIVGPKDFMDTNVNGTFTLLEASRQFWKERTDVRFHHISTDEVFGSLGEEGYFFETTPYDPRSPYAASKAASDHIVRAYHHTYGMPVTLSNCSNNYGPYQFPEKLIPLMILNAVECKGLPVYGDGRNVRDWLYVDDHCEAIWLILLKGDIGETYNVGGECEKKNLEIIEKICDLLETMQPLQKNPNCKQAMPVVKHYRDLVTFVKDRPGHDRRYAINCDKIKKTLGWTQKHDFGTGMRNTIAWFLHHGAWVNSIRSKEYLNWIETNYSR
jgi:dTDP-glucose 4,6-dehydratase